MVKNQESKTVAISFSSLEDVRTYSRSLLSILDKVEIESCTKESLEHLSAVYRLLSLLILKSESLSKKEACPSNK